MSRNRQLIFSTLIALALATASLADGHDHSSMAAEPLGKVHFPISCAAAEQPAFDRAVALLHSFGYERAEAAFSAIAKAQPTCGMAYWGIAMTNFHQVWGPPTPDELARGRAAAEKAAAVSSPDARERAWIAAIGSFFVESAPRTHPERVQAYARSMASLAAQFPADSEAQIFDALAMLAVAYNSPPDKTYARQREAAALLQKLLAQQPEHPGIAHYMIHSFDYPALAPLALDAAHAYAKIAPASPHALHMPSHIFTRLGLWQDSIASNLASADTAARLVAQSHPGATAFDGLHAMDYLEYAYLQLARDDEARGIVERAAAVKSLDQPSAAAGYALAAVPVRYALERRAWKDAAAVALHPAFPWKKDPYAEAIVHFGNAVGAARSGDVAGARAALARLTAIETALTGQPGFDWASQVKIQRLAATGWIARAEGKNDDALAALRSAADLEDTTDKHPVTPGAVLPAREQLGDLLAELGQPQAALAAYEASLKTAPARLNSLRGAALAARQSGDEARAKAFEADFAKLCAGSASPRARLGEPVPAAH